MLEKIDHENRQYVIGAGSGYVSCLGFDVVFRDAKQMAERMQRADLSPREADIGTEDQYNEYRGLCKAFAEHPSSKQTWFTPGTDPNVAYILESARSSDQRLRIFLGDTETGRDWMEEFDVIGTIGRSTGAMKTPLLLNNKSSSGGGAILTDCIVKIVDVASKRTLYQHPKYQTPEISIAPCSGFKDFSHEATANGKTSGRFKSEAHAEAWRDFMLGTRMSTTPAAKRSENVQTTTKHRSSPSLT